MQEPQDVPLYCSSTHENNVPIQRKSWVTPQLRILPVPHTQTGPQPKKPTEKLFYKTTS